MSMDRFKDMKYMRITKQIVDVLHEEDLKRYTGREAYSKSKSNFHVDYVNTTKHVLCIKDRMGIVTMVEPELWNRGNENIYNVYNHDKRGVIIRIEVGVTLDTAEASMKSLAKSVDKSDLSRHLYLEMKKTKQRLLNDKSRGGYRHPNRGLAQETIQINYFIHENTLEGSDKYFSELDVTLSLYERGEEVVEIEHPNTQEKLLGGRVDGVDYWPADAVPDNGKLNLSLYISDETGVKTVSDHYITLLGKVYKVPIIYGKPLGKKGGVSLRVERNHSSLSPTGENTHEYQTLNYSLEDAIKHLGLAESVKEAHDNVNVERRIELRKMELDHNALDTKVQLSELSREAAIESHKMTVVKIGHEKEMAGLKHIQDKYRHEIGMRNANSDTIQSIAKAIGAIGTVLAMFKWFQSLTKPSVATG